jgi:hypothetical protein
MQTSYSLNPAVGLDGALADTHRYDAVTAVNSESSAAIAPGRFVRRVAGSPQLVLLPTLAAHITGGLAGGFALFDPMHINPNTVTNVERSLFQPEEQFAYVRSGYLWIQSEQNFTEGGKVYVRFLARDAFPALGRIRADVDNFDPGGGAVNHAAECQFARFVTSGSAGDLAKVRVDILPGS